MYDGFSSAIPTAAPEREHPTSLSLPLVLSSLAFLTLYSWEHIFDITSTSPL